MADCGASGSALDRTVRAMGGAEHPDASKVLGSLLGQTSLADPRAMPHSAPQTLVMPPYNTSMPEYLHPQHRPPAAGMPQRQQQAISHQHLHPQGMQPHHHQDPGMMSPRMNPYMQQMAQQQQQQQQQQMMMMMMNMQMQQQQQQIMLAQQQQKQRAQQTAASKTGMKTELDPEIKEALREHLETLHHEGDAGHEGLVKGAGIDELAAAWAEAEAAYEAEADLVDQATNLAASVNPSPKERYEFQNTEVQPEDLDKSMNWMDEGMRYFREGNVKEAIRCFEIQLQHHNNDDSRAWRMLGECHAENDQDREAILCLEEAVDRDPYATDALLALGVSHVNELNHQRALENLKAWITHNPNYAGMEMTEDLYGASNIQGEAKAFDEVQRLLLQALEHDPSNASEILQTLGVTYNVNRDYDAAVNAFERALEQRPDDYQLWNKLGATLANGNQSEKALPAYNRALELRPRYARAWLNMAISYSNLQNYEEAARCYLQTLSLNPAATHCWSYLRIALSCSEKWDLIPLAASQDLAAFREHYDFVLYDNGPSGAPGQPE
eukprot:scaffold448_cov156-Amphora_coffeaeformis.AAC.13